MRYFEWLFPIHKYIRHRREVSGVAAVARLLACAVLLGVAFAILSFYDFRRRPIRQVAPGLTSWGGTFQTVRSFPEPSRWQQWVEDFRDFVRMHWDLLVAAPFGALVWLALLVAPEFVVSLVFVRKRPGRRRPLCVWQTCKFVLLGSQTWMLLGLACVPFALLAQRVGFEFDESAPDLHVAVGLALLVTLFLVILASTAVQAALAVIALQDDRRCNKCGYFLIGLTSSRCPECGTPFDPGKLGRLSAAAAAESEKKVE